ncbi:MAG TPA: hypothetical protein VIU13_20005 [Chryseolinea sp.]
MSKQSKSFKQKLIHEMKAVAFATLYFAIWFGILMFLKTMILSEYEVEFSGISMALIGALVLAKVALVIDHIPFSSWTRERSPIYFVIFRTLLNVVGVFIVLLLEHAFKARHEYGSFGSALINVFQHRDVYHLWASVTVVGISVFLFNVLFVLRKYIGEQKLSELFFSTPLANLLSKRETGT